MFVRLFLVACFAIGWCLPTFAQQDAQFIGFRQNALQLNPAYAGSRDVWSAIAYYRAQWVSIGEGPRTLSASLHGKRRRVGLGLWVESDQINIHRRTQVMTTYAYHIPVGRGQLSLGLSAGFLNIASDYESIENVVDTEPLAVDVRRALPNFGTGLYYYTNRSFIGFSIPHLVETQLVDNAPDSAWERHYYLTAGTVFDAGLNLKIKPAFLIKALPGRAPISADLNLTFIVNQVFGIGVSHRWSESIDFLFDWQINRQLQLGYGFDFTLTQLAGFGSSHDVFLRYEFGFTRDKVVTPRYF